MKKDTETKDTIGDEKYIKDDSDCFTPLIENNNIETESLEDAAKKHSPARVGINSFPEKKAFIAGGNWQKEKDKVIIDKLLLFVKMVSERGYDPYENDHHLTVQNFVNEADQLLNSLK